MSFGIVPKYDERFFSAFFCLIQTSRTRAEVPYVFRPKTWGWRRTSFRLIESRESATEKTPRSSSIRARKTTSIRTSPSSSATAWVEPRLIASTAS